MPSTARDIDHTGATTAICASNLGSRLRDALLAQIARRQTRRIVRGLSDAQLLDTGIDRAAVLGDRPVIGIDAGLATYLASLR